MFLHKVHRIFIVALLVILIPAAAFAAATYTVKAGDTLGKIAVANHTAVSQLAALNPQIKNINIIYPGQIIKLSSSGITSKVKPAATSTQASTQPVVVVPPATSVPPAAGESRFMAYTTGYGWPDNTPKGSADISNPILHSQAGGTGTYADPITLAVGHSISGGTDTLDYKAGTKFYIPALRKYFIVEDTCGDGNSPQNGPCHTGYQGLPWLDIWVGGNSSNQSATLLCEDAITETHLVIQNPASTYKVAAGDVAGTCQIFTDTILSAVL